MKSPERDTFKGKRIKKKITHLGGCSPKLVGLCWLAQSYEHKSK